MLMNYGFLLTPNKYSSIDIHISELERAFYTLFPSFDQRRFFKQKFATWEYDADVSGVREYSHDCFKVYYDRIPFKLDDFVTHLFTDVKVFIPHYQNINWYKSDVELENINQWELQELIKKDMVSHVLEERLLELDNLQINFEKMRKDLDDTKIYQLTGLYETHRSICENRQSDLQTSLKIHKESLLLSTRVDGIELKRNDSFTFQNGIEA